MRISIVTAAHNEEELIGECLKSVALQTHDDVEHLVVCDACTDGTADVVRQYGLEPIEVDVRSTGEAINVGLEKATGEYWFGLGGDDYLPSKHVIQTLHDRLTLNPVDILSFGCYFGNRVASCYYEGTDKPWPNVGFNIFRTAAFPKGGFPSQSYLEDQAWFHANVTERATVDFLDLPLYQYRYPQEKSAIGRVHGDWWDRTLTGENLVEARHITTLLIPVAPQAIAEAVMCLEEVSSHEYLIPPRVILVIHEELEPEAAAKLSNIVGALRLAGSLSLDVISVPEGDLPIGLDRWAVLSDRNVHKRSLRAMQSIMRYVARNESALEEVRQTTVASVEHLGLTMSFAEQRHRILTEMAQLQKDGVGTGLSRSWS